MPKCTGSIPTVAMIGTKTRKGHKSPGSNPRVRTFAPPDGRSILPGQNRSRSDTALHALTASPDISPTDRLSVTVFFSVLAHVIVISA